jgi:hypothetical protein
VSKPVSKKVVFRGARINLKLKIMKNSTIIIFLVLVILKTQAQDYLISFAGAGDTTEVGTVKVDNLTSGATVTLNGGDILHLFGSVGIGAPDSDNGTLQVYPNPMAEQSMLTFIAPENGNTVIGIGYVFCEGNRRILFLFCKTNKSKQPARRSKD